MNTERERAAPAGHREKADSLSSNPMSRGNLQAACIRDLESALERVTLSDDINVARMIASDALARYGRDSENRVAVFCPKCDFRGVASRWGGECPVCHAALRPADETFDERTVAKIKAAQAGPAHDVCCDKFPACDCQPENGTAEHG